MYFSHFEGPFLASSKVFFTAEGNQAINTVDVSHFLLLVDKRLAEVTFSSSVSNSQTAALLSSASSSTATSSSSSHQANSSTSQDNGAVFSSNAASSAGHCVYIDTSSIKSLCDVIYCHLFAPHVHSLLEKGLTTLFDENRVDDIRRFFLLLEKIQMLDVLKSAWSLYIRQKGEAIVNETMQSVVMTAAMTSKSAFGPSSSSGSGGIVPASPAAAGGAATGEDSQKNNFVEDVLVLLDRLEVILKRSFHQRHLFVMAMKQSFEHFLNIHQKVTAEQLARYVDKKLRHEKGVSEVEIEQRLESSMKVFHYLQEKDIFEAFYKKHLSKRLLLNKSASTELEQSMLTKLKAECGSQFTAKLEGMFNDVELSRQVQTQYATYVAGRHQSSSDVEMSVQVLTTGYWPSTSNASEGSIVLPTELSIAKTRFTTFYTNAYQGRRLTWSHSLARCIVMARFTKGKKELDVTLYQALVLKCFNGNDRLSLADIKKTTGLETEECRRTLQSLACGMLGTRVLTKEPK